MNQRQDDEIDLFELLQTLWDGKLLISMLVAITVLLGSIFLFLKKDVYVSKLMYYTDTIPPFYDENKVLKDFRKNFYSVRIFENWKKTNKNTSLVFADFSTTEIVDGFVVSKNEDLQLAKLDSEVEIGPFIIVKSNQLSILNDFFLFARHINKLLKNEYISRAKDELNIIETRFQNFSTANDAVIAQILQIDRFIVSSEIGAAALTIQRPTMPKNVSTKPIIILTICAFLGGMVGVFFILVRNAKKKRKEQLAIT